MPKAMFNSTCYVCKKPTYKGELLTVREIDGKARWIHPVCPSADKPVSTVVKVSPESVITLSTEQKAIADFASNDNRNLIIEAGAGSGKSTMLLTIAHRLNNANPTLNMVYLVFGKKQADEAVEKFPDWITCATTNSLGYRIYSANVGRVLINKDKIQELVLPKFAQFDVSAQGTSEDKKRIKMLCARMEKLVDYTMAQLIDPTDVEALRNMIAAYPAIGLGEDENICIGMLPAVMDVCMKMSSSVINLNEQLYLPVKLGLRPAKPYDVVLADEAQDFTPCQIVFVATLGKRIIGVGDDTQAIMGFRGASLTALSDLGAMVNAINMPMAETRRCPKSHVLLANEYMPLLRATSDAIDGIIEQLTMAQFNPPDGALVICTTNAPLVLPCLSLLKQGRRAVIVGKNIGASLIILADRLSGKCKNLSEMYANLQAYNVKQSEWLDAHNARSDKYTELADTIAIITAIMEVVNIPDEVGTQLQALFSDDTVDGVNFSSGHKAKGLEAKHVYILQPERMPLLRDGQNDSEVKQARNLAGVMLTRSLYALYFVAGA